MPDIAAELARSLALALAQEARPAVADVSAWFWAAITAVVLAAAVLHRAPRRGRRRCRRGRPGRGVTTSAR